jgi:replicative DNA helicase
MAAKKTQLELTEPYNPGAERYIITCCMKNQEVILDVLNHLKPSDFYVDLHKYTYQVILSLVEQDMVPEPVTIFNKLSDAGIAKPEHLKQLELMKAASYDLKNLDEYIGIVKSASVKRQLKNQVIAVLNSVLLDEKVTGSDAIEACEESILEIAVDNSDTSAVYQMGSETAAILSERMENPVEVMGIPTGYGKLDQQLGGLQPGRLYVFSARPKVGKSILLLNIVKHVAIDLGIPVLMIDTEMDHRLVEDRLISLISGVEERKIENGLFAASDKDFKAVMKAGQVVQEALIYHHYMSNFTMEGLISVAKKYKLQKNVGLVVFDYIKTPDDTDFASIKEYQSLGQLTSGLKNKIAGALEIPVITACQLGRSAIGESRGSDEHVADSDRISRYADSIIFFRQLTDKERETYGEGPAFGNRIMHVQLNRGGPAQEGLYCVYFDAPVMSMREVGVRKF